MSQTGVSKILVKLRAYGFKFWARHAFCRIYACTASYFVPGRGETLTGYGRLQHNRRAWSICASLKIASMVLQNTAKMKFKTYCGPSCANCCLLLSIWGILQLVCDGGDCFIICMCFEYEDVHKEGDGITAEDEIFNELIGVFELSVV